MPHHSTYTFCVVLCIAVRCLIVTTTSGYADEIDPPNIVFILADDLGWSDTTLFGTTDFYQTPNIERLAQRGMTFSQAYAASPLCSPTRASILTGQNPARVGITAPVCHLPQVRLEPTVADQGPATQKALTCQSATRLKRTYLTLGKSLQSAGYATGHFGKWHLGHEPYDPLHHGFDVDIPHWPGPGPAGSFVAPWRFPNFKERVPGEHIEDRMGDEAIAFIQQHKDEPFFVNYWQFSVHAPFDAKQEYIQRHRERVDPTDPQRSPTYAAMVQSLDDNVGKILDTLDRLEIAQRTIIIFFSDNGGNMYNRVDDTTPTSNDPLRGGKATMYEGGIRVPCIVVWPGHVETGSRSTAVIQSVDFFPTILDMLNLKQPSDTTFDGISIRPALAGNQLSRDAIFTFFPHSPKVPEWLPPSVAVRHGDWKLIRIFHDGEPLGHRYELYNLQQDLAEEVNLATQHPDIVRRLDQQIEQFLVDTQAVRPMPNPDYDPGSARLIKLGITPLHHCQMQIDDAVLQLTATGTDPYFKLEPSDPLPAGEFRLEFRMKSTGNGESRLYWHTLNTRPAHHRSRSVALRPTHDGRFHDYQAEFTTDKTLLSLRLDPIQSPGKCEFNFIRLLDAQGQLLASWDFHNINEKAKASENVQQNEAESSSVQTDEPDKLPEAEPLTKDEQYRQLVVGVWEDDYKGKRTMHLKADGTGKMVVQLSGMSAALFASKLEFDMVWLLKEGRLKKRTIRGRPKRRVDMILKTMGDRVNEKILQLDEDRLLLLDQDGETRYDWRRKR